jgi:hypothetical protein
MRESILGDFLFPINALKPQFHGVLGHSRAIGKPENALKGMVLYPSCNHRCYSACPPASPAPRQESDTSERNLVLAESQSYTFPKKLDSR